MADFKWTGGAGTGDFGTAQNWQNLTTGQDPAVAPPGETDVATIDVPALTVTGNGAASVLALQGGVTLADELLLLSGSQTADTAYCGTRIDGTVTLKPNAVLETILLSVGFSENSSGTLVVGPDSCVLIAGPHPLDNYAISVAVGTGSTGVMTVSGKNAIVSGGNVPLVVGHDGTGTLKIEDGAIVTSGPMDTAINSGVAVGNHGGSNGHLSVKNAALLTTGAILVGRSSIGLLEVGPGGVVSGAKLAFGSNAAGVGTGTVSGAGARVIVSTTLQVGGPGAGALTIADEGIVSVSQSATVDGALTLDKGSLNALSVGVSPAGTISGGGVVLAVDGVANAGEIKAIGSLTIIGPVSNEGALAADEDSELVLVDALTGTGPVTLSKGSTVSFDATALELPITFAGKGAKIIIRNPAGFLGTVEGFGKGDTIEVDAVATAVAVAAGILTLTGPGGSVATITLLGAYTAANFTLTMSPQGRSVLHYHP